MRRKKKKKEKHGRTDARRKEKKTARAGFPCALKGKKGKREVF